MRIRLLAGIAACALAFDILPTFAQEVTLRAVTSFAEGTQFSKNFERFIETLQNVTRLPVLDARLGPAAQVTTR